LPRVQVNVAPGCEAGAGARVCFAGNVTACRADGSLGAEVEQCPDGCAHGRCTQTCEAQGVELVYVIDKANTLHAFDPRAVPGEEFRRIGTLTCAAGDSPFSMTVDRRGVGWVLFHSGRMFRVSVVTGACLGEVAFEDSVPMMFGQAFVRDVAASPPQEVLMISVNDDRPSSRLGALDLARTPASWRAIGPLPAGWIYTPDLTTTADGRLFAYVAAGAGRPAGDAGLVQELSPRTGKPVGRAMKVAGRRRGRIGQGVGARALGRHVLRVPHARRGHPGVRGRPQDPGVAPGPGWAAGPDPRRRGVDLRAAARARAVTSARRRDCTPRRMRRRRACRGGAGR
jgi:hypothetical protein